MLRSSRAVCSCLRATQTTPRGPSFSHSFRMSHFFEPCVIQARVLCVWTDRPWAVVLVLAPSGVVSGWDTTINNRPMHSFGFSCTAQANPPVMTRQRYTGGSQTDICGELKLFRFAPKIIRRWQKMVVSFMSDSPPVWTQGGWVLLLWKDRVTQLSKTHARL